MVKTEIKDKGTSEMEFIKVDCRVEGGFTITVPTQGKNTTFVLIPFGEDNVHNLRKNVREAGLEMPTLSELVSLYHTVSSLRFFDVLEGKSHYERSKYELAKRIVKYVLHGESSSLTDTAMLYVPNKGLYVQDHPKTETIEGEKGPQTIVVMEPAELEARLKGNDLSVRFSPGYNLPCEIEYEKLMENDSIKALAGQEEGVKQLAELTRLSEFGEVDLITTGYDNKPAFAVIGNISRRGGRFQVRRTYADNSDKVYAFAVCSK